jgi:hypothetical protein
MRPGLLREEPKFPKEPLKEGKNANLKESSGGEMPKKICLQNYQNAYDILYGEWLTVHPTDHVSADEKEGPLHSDGITPEDAIIKIEAFSALSNEAKEVIKTVLYTPTEILQFLGTPKTKKLTARSVKAYFTQQWRSKFIADIAIKEIIKWVAKL